LNGQRSSRRYRLHRNYPNNTLDANPLQAAIDLITNSSAPCQHPDPTRPITTIKTAWGNAKERAGVTGRLHDSRHTLITELAESGAGDQTIMDIAGHVSRQMLKHYSHIRMEAKREALETVWKKQQEAEAQRQAEEAKPAQACSPSSADAQKVEVESLQKSLQSGVSGGLKGRKRVRKSLKRIGSSGRTRTLTIAVLSASC
jgi:hypothetical protein